MGIENQCCARALSVQAGTLISYDRIPAFGVSAAKSAKAPVSAKWPQRGPNQFRAVDQATDLPGIVHRQNIPLLGSKPKPQLRFGNDRLCGREVGAGKTQSADRSVHPVSKNEGPIQIG